MNVFSSLFNLPCTKATELVEKKNLVPLTKLEGFALKFHLSVCKACLNYQFQSECMERAIKKNMQQAVFPENGLVLSEQVKQRIAQALINTSI
jgi:hypothetical protein